MSTTTGAAVGHADDNQSGSSSSNKKKTKKTSGREDESGPPAAASPSAISSTAADKATSAITAPSTTTSSSSTGTTTARRAQRRPSVPAASSPASYAYGAPSTAVHSPHRRNTNAMSSNSNYFYNRDPRGNGDDEYELDDGMSARSAATGTSSRRTGSAAYPGAWNGASVTSSPGGGPPVGEPAHIRYARLKQRMKDTGSPKAPKALDDEDENEDQDETASPAATTAAGGDAVDHQGEAIKHVRGDIVDGEALGDTSASRNGHGVSSAKSNGGADAGTGGPRLGPNAVASRQQQQQQQRGNGTKVLQHSAQPDETAFKATSVNIATAFRQAVGGSSALPHHQQQSNSSSNSNNYSHGGGVGFLARAGDRNHTLQEGAAASSGYERQQDDVTGDLSTESHPSPSRDNTKETQLADPDANTTSNSAKKRKKPSSSTAATASASRARRQQDDDGAFRPSKQQLNEVSSDEFEDSDSSDVNLEELRFEMGFGSGNRPLLPSEQMELDRKRGALQQKRRAAKKAKRETAGQDGGDGDDLETSTTTSRAPLSKRTSGRRKSAPSDGAYKPGQEGDEVEEDDEYGEGSSRRRRSGNTKRGKARETSVASSPAMTESTNAADTASRTSFYLQEPGAPGEQPRLTQIHPKTNTYQPYFAYSTAPTTNLPPTSGHNRSFAALNTASTSTTYTRSVNIPVTGLYAGARHQRGSSISSSVQTGNTSLVPNVSGDLSKGPSSNASFDLRGSDYDYAEEERMVDLIMKQKQSQQGGQRTLPEGRPIPDILVPSLSNQQHQQQGKNTLYPNYGHTLDREVSVAGSDFSNDSLNIGGSAQQQQRKLQPRRGPAPPRSPSVVSDTSHPAHHHPADPPSSAAAAGTSRSSGGSFGRKLGEIMRKIAVLLYYLIVTPTQWLRQNNPSTLLKWAVLLGIVGLMLGSMNERAATKPAHPSTRSWLPLFGSAPSSSQHRPSFELPDQLPRNLDELVSRLTSLETSFAGLSEAQYAIKGQSEDQIRSHHDVSRKVAALEDDFESERRKAHKALEGVRSEGKKGVDALVAEFKGVTSQLDTISNKLKALEGERTHDAADIGRFRGDFTALRKDLSGLSDSLKSMKTELHDVRNSHADKTTKMVIKLIEDILPSRMAVSLNPTTGTVDIDPAFWQHLQTAFGGTKGKVAKSPGSSSSTDAVHDWADFLRKNEERLKSFVGEQVEGQVHKGAILGRKTFLEVLERELLTLKAEMSSATSEDLSKLSTELSQKLSRATASIPASSASKPSTVKLSSGEDLHSIVSEIVASALDMYSKDVLARPDYALYTSGGRVIPSLTSPTYEVRPVGFLNSLLATITQTGVLRGKPPATALHHDISVGNCWPIAGSQGQLGILLSRRILVQDITIEHASKDIALDVSTAPKRFEAWGVIESQADVERYQQSALSASAGPGSSSNPTEGGEQQGQKPAGVSPSQPTNRILLASGSYDVHASSHIQTFPVDHAVRDLEIPVNVVILKILDNHGSQALSCLYRVRVGGTVAAEE